MNMLISTALPEVSLAVVVAAGTVVVAAAGTVVVAAPVLSGAEVLVLPPVLQPANTDVSIDKHSNALKNFFIGLPLSLFFELSIDDI